MKTIVEVHNVRVLLCDATVDSAADEWFCINDSTTNDDDNNNNNNSVHHLHLNPAT